jgi:predicted nucleotidyltransferase
MARGGADDSSDVDLLVELPAGVSGLALCGLLLDAQDLLGRKVDVVTEDALPSPLRRIIVEQAVPL